MSDEAPRVKAGWAGRGHSKVRISVARGAVTTDAVLTRDEATELAAKLTALLVGLCADDENGSSCP